MVSIDVAINDFGFEDKDGKFEEYKEPYASIDCKTEEDFKMIQEAVKQYRGWIDVEQELPKDDNYILLSFSNFSTPAIGRYEEDENGGIFYIGDEDESCVSQDLYVNAWRPLPEPYQESEE